MNAPLPQARIQSIPAPPLLPVTIDVLRLDELHPVVSGNKWFKLKVYLAQARLQNVSCLVTFGGAYSNHLVATAAAAQLQQLQSIGIVRGEAPAVLSHTLLAAQRYGMELHFVSRTAYREKHLPAAVAELVLHNKALLIPEGGYGPLGAEGASEILHRHTTTYYSHIVTAVGTGTTLAGLVTAALPSQQVLGIPVLKNAGSLRAEINQLLPADKQNRFELLEDYHFGGYAKKSDALFTFMNDFFLQTGIPTDFVYTAKAFRAVFDLAEKKYFPAGSKILLLHTGGLQGNGSLKKGTLIFD